MTAPNGRPPGLRALHRTRVAEMYCSGYRQIDMAEELHVAQSTISSDIKAILAEWQHARTGSTTQWMNEELAKLNALELQYWEGWRRSCAERKRTVTGARTGTAPSTQATVTKQTGEGNPAFLAGVMAVIERRCKLLGLDAPAAVQLGATDNFLAALRTFGSTQQSTPGIGGAVVGALTAYALGEDTEVE